MSKRTIKTLAIILLSAVATVFVAGQEASQMVGVAARPAGCHQHSSGQSSEHGSPQPVSYRCCQIGHNAAVLQSSLASQLSFTAVNAGDLTPAPIQISIPNSPQRLNTSTSDPPHSTPLRV